MDVHVIAPEVFSVAQFCMEQIEDIMAITEGENVIAAMPAGFGKSLCYQAGTILQEGFTIAAITPLLTLCEDQMA
jgi:ATP-dependent DNA helicase RecQ